MRRRMRNTAVRLQPTFRPKSWETCITLDRSAAPRHGDWSTGLGSKTPIRGSQGPRLKPSCAYQRRGRGRVVHPSEFAPITTHASLGTINPRPIPPGQTGYEATRGTWGQWSLVLDLWPLGGLIDVRDVDKGSLRRSGPIKGFGCGCKAVRKAERMVQPSGSGL
jgi:hypothetical protein